MMVGHNKNSGVAGAVAVGILRVGMGLSETLVS